MFNNWLIVNWFVAALPPETPLVTTGVGQVYFVPVGIIVEGNAVTGAIKKLEPLHMERFWAGITGAGFTVSVNVNDEPGQFPVNPDVGVTV